MPSILVVGAGAIGAFFGSALARQGGKVSVVCRTDHAVVKRDGYGIRSPLLGDHRFRPEQVLKNADECGSPPDYVILATKVLPQTDRAALLRGAVGNHTVIVLIQNGIDIETDVANAFPHNELLSGIAFIAVARTGPGEIDHQSAGSLTLGRYPEGITSSARSLAALFEASKVPCRLTEDVVTARWQKALWNATFNPISMMGGVLDTSMMLRTAEDRAFVRKAMHEIADIAAAAGHPLDLQIIEMLIEATRAMPAYKTSMALDFEHGRPMEIEAILGNVVRTARDCKAAAPTLEAVYAIAKMVENKKGIADGG